MGVNQQDTDSAQPHAAVATEHKQPGKKTGWISSSAILLLLGYLWFVLINQLRVEWTLNPQYSYGWAVPFLCAYLVWEARKRVPSVSSMLSPSSLAPPLSAFQRFRFSASFLSASQSLKSQILNLKLLRLSAFQFFSISVFAFSWFPIRLIQAANPDWRLVSWALALDVVGLTLLLLRNFRSEISDLRSVQSGRNTDNFKSQISNLKFPILFFLVAVPWPTGIEMPLIQALTRANAAVTVEVLNLLGISAIQHGNVLEVATGMVGIDEACSGIRSFQATLMISLFLGQVYRLTVSRRLIAVLAGFGLSFLFNIIRTSLLTAVAARDGVDAIAKWHDPAGVTILVACFLCLWALTSKLGDRRLKIEDGGPSSNSHLPSSINAPSSISHLPSSISAFQFFSVSAFLFLWLVLSDLAVEGWYRWNERHLDPPVTWTFQLPNSPTLAQVPWGEKSRRMLRFSESTNIRWTEAGHAWAAIFMRWDPQTIGINLPNMHTPNVCLTAAGFNLVGEPENRLVAASDLQLPCRFYRFQSSQGPVNVLYCLWEDYQPKGHLASPAFTRQMRMSAVLQGRRNLSQRSLELAVRGVEDPSQAENLLKEMAARLVKRENREEGKTVER